MKYTSIKELNQFIDELIRRGWTVTRNKHVKLRSPRGYMVTCSVSPSCHHAVENFKKDVQRIERKEAHDRDSNDSKDDKDYSHPKKPDRR